MCAKPLVVKSRVQLWDWGQADLGQLVDYTVALQQ